LFIDALAMTKRLFAGDHPDVATSLNNLALLYNSQGRYNEAEPLHQEALKIAEVSLDVNHPNTITIRGNLKYLRDNRRSKLANVVSFVKRLFSNRGN
ncbi:tetratricopeptide repeat protein, partial [Aetokthonos hydrillicola]